MRVYARKIFPPTGQKIIACGQHICPKRKNRASHFTAYSVKISICPLCEAIIFSRGDVLRTLCYTPQTKRQKFQEEKTKLLYKIQINPNKKIDSVVNLFMVQLSLYWLSMSNLKRTFLISPSLKQAPIYLCTLSKAL